MSKQIEALKLAIEVFGGGDWHDEIVDTDWADKANNTITALREALAEQPAQQEPYAWMHTKIDDVFIKHRPADIRRHPDRWMALYKDPTPCQTCEALARTVMMDQTAHDIPPSREWVGLTDEQLDEWTPEIHVVIRAIEAKLKEKNT